MMYRKQLSRFIGQRLWIGLVLAVMIMGGCRDEKPIRVGYAGPLTGKLADLGIAGRDGVLLAVEQANATGGCRGRRIDLLVRDDEQNLQQARKVDRELIDAGVVAIIGHMTSAMSVAALPVVNNANIVMISPTTSSNELMGLDDNFIRVYPPSCHVARLLSTHAFNRGVTSISIVYDTSNEAHTLGWYNYFRENFEHLGGRVLDVFPYESGKEDYAAIAKEISKSGSKGVFIIAGAVDTAMICQHLRKAGHHAPVFVSEWATTDDLINHGGAAVEGVTFFQTFDRNSNYPAYMAFKKAYVERFRREPTFASVHAYDSMKVLLDALNKDLKFGSLKSAILAKKYRGLQHDITFDPYGDPQNRSFLMTVKNGSFQRLR